MIIIDQEHCRFPLFVGKFFEKEIIWRPTVDLQIYSSIVNFCLLIYYLLVLEKFDVLRSPPVVLETPKAIEEAQGHQLF